MAFHGDIPRVFCGTGGGAVAGSAGPCRRHRIDHLFGHAKTHAHTHAGSGAAAAGFLAAASIASAAWKVA